MIGALRFRLSGYARGELDAELLCGECMVKWSYGEWFPRWCRYCRRAKGAS